MWNIREGDACEEKRVEEFIYPWLIWLSHA